MENVALKCFQGIKMRHVSCFSRSRSKNRGLSSVSLWFSLILISNFVVLAEALASPLDAPPNSIAPSGQVWKMGGPHCGSGVDPSFPSAMATYEQMKACRVKAYPGLIMVLESMDCSPSFCQFWGHEGGSRGGSFGIGAELHTSPTPYVNGENGGCKVGNPCNPGTGNKSQREVDYLGSGPYPLSWVRTYNSLTYTAPDARLALGWRWRHRYDTWLAVTELPAQSFHVVNVYRGNDRVIPFYLEGGVWKTSADVADTLTEVVDANGVRSGWKYFNAATQETETYSAGGRLLSVASRAGLAHALNYDASGRLISVNDDFGRALTFAHDANGRISTVTDPAGGVIRYGYDADGNLVSATRQDGTTRAYHYEDTRFPHTLTGITDENGIR